jgi:hypothetical protein
MAGLTPTAQKEDVLPLIENERLVNFRINYLRTKAWGQDCLLEYYTIAFKYEHDGNYGLSIWRAGTGEHYASRTESRLWDLGDCLSRLTSWKGVYHLSCQRESDSNGSRADALDAGNSCQGTSR